MNMQNLDSVSEQKLTGRILLVDDDELCIKSGSIVLEANGFKVVTASGGIQALDYLRAHPNDIDVVLLDLMMHDMHGLNVLEDIKADPKLKHIQVIIQSGLSDSDKLSKALELGAGHLSKPYSRKSLFAAIQGVLGNRACA